VRIKPRRDPAGRLVAPARVWLTSEAHPEPAPAGVTATLPLAGGSLRSLRVGDALQTTDLRGANASSSSSSDRAVGGRDHREDHLRRR